MIDDEERLPGDGLYIRLVRVNDCGERYVSWLLDPEVNRFLETRFAPQTPASVEEFVQRMRASPDNFLFAIVTSANDMHVGNLKIGPVNWTHRNADISYFIGEKDAWNKGVATEAIRVATRVAFDRLGLHRLQAFVYSENRPSAAALERAGYTHEGTLREKVSVGEGRNDQLVFGMLASDKRERAIMTLRSDPVRGADNRQ
ncbi:MAG TPA: GNAT family protein [Gemmatimonadaceae bacterium]|nr:GNAT family protein [Gemmatimonadaceae bacterium]